MTLSKVLSLSLLTIAFSGFANNELDQGSTKVNQPKGLIVRVDTRTGKASVFPTDEAKVVDNKDASAVVAKLDNKGTVKAVDANELDNTTSQSAWCYHYYQPYYSAGYYPYYYSYYYNNSCCNYYPYYSYNYGYYNYYYYYSY